MRLASKNLIVVIMEAMKPDMAPIRDRKARKQLPIARKSGLGIRRPVKNLASLLSFCVE